MGRGSAAPPGNGPPRIVAGDPDRAGFVRVDIREQSGEADARTVLASERDARIDSMRSNQVARMVEPVQARVPFGIAGQDHVVVARPAEVPDRRQAVSGWSVPPSVDGIEVVQRPLERFGPDHRVVHVEGDSACYPRPRALAGSRLESAGADCAGCGGLNSTQAPTAPQSTNSPAPASQDRLRAWRRGPPQPPALPCAGLSVPDRDWRSSHASSSSLKA